MRSVRGTPRRKRNVNTSRGGRVQRRRASTQERSIGSRIRGIFT